MNAATGLFQDFDDAERASEQLKKDGTIHSPVIGVFANPQDAYDAIEELQAQGFTHRDVEMVDQTRLGYVVQLELSDATLSGVVTDRETGDALVATGTPAALVDPVNYLANLGVPEKAIPFSVGAVQRGGALVIVSVGDEQAQVAWQTMRKAGAMNLTQEG